MTWSSAFEAKVDGKLESVWADAVRRAVLNRNASFPIVLPNTSIVPYSHRAVPQKGEGGIFLPCGYGLPYSNFTSQ